MNGLELREKLFDCLVNLHLKTKKPIGSKILKRRYFRNIAESTIRIYLSEMVSEKLLENVNFSLGRIPTDRGWRVYLNKNLARDRNLIKKSELKKIPNSLSLAEYLSKKFKVYCLFRSRSNWCEVGLENILDNQEFTQRDIFVEFANLLKDIKGRYYLLTKKEELIKIYIGSEIPFRRYKNFSIIISENKFGDKIFTITLKCIDYPKAYNLLRVFSQNG